MQSSINQPIKKKRYVWNTVGNVFVIFVLSLFFLIFLAIILIQTAPVQNYARIKIQSYLQKKLNTRVEIGHININFPNSILLKDVFIEDQSKDTLLSGGQMKVNLNMFRLLKNEVQVNNIDLQDVTLKLKRLQPDTVFNFQFIVDAFSGKTQTPKSTDTTASIKLNIDNISVARSRIVYRDTLTGNDMDLYVKKFESKISRFDPYHMYFDVPNLSISGLHGYFYQNEPLKQKIVLAVAKATQQPDAYLQFINKTFSLDDIDVDYKSAPTNIQTSVKIGSLVAHPDTLNLRDGKFDFKDVLMDKATIGVVMSDTKAPPVTQVTQQALNSLPPFTLKSDNLRITNSNFTLDDISMPRVTFGMDYGHMNFKELNVDAANLFFNVDTIETTLKSASLKEKSGFILNDLSTDFLYTPTGTSLRNLYIKTPGSLLRKDAAISYPSLDALVKDPGIMGLDMDIVNSAVQVKDLLTFVPLLKGQGAFSNPSDIYQLNGHITGRVNNMHLENLKIKGHQTSLIASGFIKGIPDPNKISANLTIPYFQSSREDLASFIPKGSLPAGFTLPQNIITSGTISGNKDNLTTHLLVRTSVGNANINGTVKNITDSKKSFYDLDISTTGLNIGQIIGQPATMGSISTHFRIKGTGFDPQMANAKVDGIISSAEFNGYNYRNIKLIGAIGNRKYNVAGSIQDPNAALSFTARGSFTGKYLSAEFTANIDSLKTFPLHLTPQPLIYHGNIEGNFSSLDPDNLVGNAMLTHSIIVNNGQRMQFDTLQLIASNERGNHQLHINSDFFNLAIDGVYKLTQLADVLQQSIDPYFAISAKKNTTHVDPYHFTINGGLVYTPALKAFFPSITQMKPVLFSGTFASDSGWNAFVSAPLVTISGYTINELKLTAGTKNGSLVINSSMLRLNNGSSIALFATSLNASLQNNKLDFTLSTKDASSIDKYSLSATLDQTSANNYTFSLKPDNLLLNYKKWSVNANNSIQYFNSDITATNFIISQDNQQLTVNSIGSGNNKPLSIDFKNFNISTLTAFAQTDSLLVNGILDGNATVKNFQTQPTFTSDLTIHDLSIYKDTLGTLTAKINNSISNQYSANVSLLGRGNKVSITGDYFVKAGNTSSFDLLIDVEAFQMASLEAFTKGGIKNSRGNLFGKININGTIDKPNIDGRINFNNTAFTVSSLNSVFKVDKEAIAIINNKGIILDKFTIRDTANNAIVIDGAINSVNFLNYSFNLTIKADNFEAINSTKKNNRLFYGKMVFSTSLSIKGTPTNPVIDGSITINDKTNFSVVLPQDEPGVVQREGIIRFVDYSKTSDDSLFMMAPYDSLKVSPFLGYNVSVNLNVSPGATFNLIVDEGNGDFLKLKGQGQLTAGIDESGKITLVGSYEINEGSYDLSFNFIKRKFNIEKGSRIVWTGEPTTADVNVTAVYIANTPPLDLVQGQTVGDPNIYKQKLPFEVHLGITGELLKPQIAFDIILPEENNYNVSKDIISTVETKLIQLRQEPGELNKQVFALLLLNRFVGQNPFDNSSGGALDANTFARESVSRLLTEQLNKLTEGLIEGVDINFDLATTEDYTTGSMQNRTNFNVGLSKRLLNDRLTVTVGSDFELEGPRPTNQQQNNVAGNIAIDYKLSKDGRYLLRAYRKNDYEGAIEGYIIETGVGFIISVDYNRFRQIFQYRKSRLAVNKKNRELDKQEAAKTKEQQSINANQNAK